MRRLLLFSILVILYGSFYPWHFAYVPGRPFLLPVSLSDKRDLILNFWLYVPIGAFAFWAFERLGALRWVVSLCLGVALSTIVELLQYFVPSRVSSLGDILANGAGTLGGVALAAWIGAFPRFTGWRMRRSPEACLLVVWVAFLVFPLFPVHGPWVLLSNIRAAQASVFLWTDLIVWTIAWLAVWQMIPRAFERDVYWIAVVLLFLMLPARLFLILRVLTKAELAAGIIGLCAAPLFRRKQLAPWAVASMVFAALILRGLTPLEFSAFPAPFQWIPLSGVLNAPWQPALLIVIGKMFWYGAAIWALERCGLSAIWSAVLVAVFLGGIEAIQRYMPAHVPEITDPLLALACAGALHLAWRGAAFEPSGKDRRLVSTL